MRNGPVSSRVALLLRSAEGKPSFASISPVNGSVKLRGFAGVPGGQFRRLRLLGSAPPGGPVASAAGLSAWSYSGFGRWAHRLELVFPPCAPGEGQRTDLGNSQRRFFSAKSKHGKSRGKPVQGSWKGWLPWSASASRLTWWKSQPAQGSQSSAYPGASSGQLPDLEKFL